LRHILVESARRKGRVRHGSGRTRRTFGRHPADDLLALDNALDRLGKRDPVKGEVVKLRYFAGLTVPEVAVTRGISVATAQRHWAFARTWLFTELNDAEENPPAV
jgi:DNA-directed RNA polymerase specialized sigma24 family protein